MPIFDDVRRGKLSTLKCPPLIFSTNSRLSPQWSPVWGIFSLSCGNKHLVQCSEDSYKCSEQNCPTPGQETAVSLEKAASTVAAGELQLSQLSSVICPLSFVKSPLSYVLFRMSYVICPLSFVLCHLSCVKCPMSLVLCHLCFVICPMSFVLCRLSYVICPITPILYCIPKSHVLRQTDLSNVKLCHWSYVICPLKLVPCLLSYVICPMQVILSCIAYIPCHMSKLLHMHVERRNKFHPKSA